MESNYEATDAMMRVYTPYAYLLTAETDKKVASFIGDNKVRDGLGP